MSDEQESAEAPQLSPEELSAAYLAQVSETEYYQHMAERLARENERLQHRLDQLAARADDQMRRMEALEEMLEGFHTWLRHNHIRPISPIEGES